MTAPKPDQIPSRPVAKEICVKWRLRRQRCRGHIDCCMPHSEFVIAVELVLVSVSVPATV